MSREIESINVDFNSIKNCEWFTTDQAGISWIKRITRQETREFLYLRKGEDFGGLLQFLVELASQAPEQIEATFSLYMDTFPDLLKDIDYQSLVKLDWAQILAFYIVMSKGKELIVKSEKKLAEWLRIGKPKLPKLPDLRIICNPDEVNEAARLGWESLGFKVRHYRDTARAGTHRYYLSEKCFVFFIRRPDRTFFGFRGTDSSIIRDLKKQFEEEWTPPFTKEPDPI